MQARQLVTAAFTAVAMLFATGCTVVRDQQTVGSYIDDTTLTTRVKAKFAEDPRVSALAIKVETYRGVVQLSGVARNVDEKIHAGQLARGISGVAGVRNDIVIGG